MVKIVISAGNMIEGSGGLQVYKQELCQELVLADVAALVYWEEGREIISDTFSKDVSAFTWQPSDTSSLRIDEVIYSLNKSGKSENADMTDKH